MAAAAATNPFDELHPVIRNEEDEIRKGIFSFALRKLHGLALEEKLVWCAAIRESTVPKQAKGRCAVAKALPLSPATAPTTTAAVALEKGGGEGVAVVGEGERGEAGKRQRSHSPGRTATAARVEAGEAEGASSPPTTASAVTASVAAEAQSPALCADVTDLPTTTDAASEFISAYMRTLLDKVVGGSLNDLAVPALRVLCQMVGITTTARSKDALYSMLANFHFTKCAKLGKRVSKQTFVQQEALQTAEMMSKLPSAASSATTGRKAVAPTKQPIAAPTEKRAKKADTAKSETKAERHAGRLVEKAAKVTSSPRTSAPSAVRKVSSATASGSAMLPYSDSDVDYDDDDSSSDGEALDVSFQPRVFTGPSTTTRTASTATAAPPLSTSSPMSENAWTTQDLDRKIASIVQLYDPVTVAIVVKKLNQMGFREANAADIVENTLKRFHRMQLVFYDNGIAYML